MQYDHGAFTSKPATLSGMTTHAEATLKTFHILYKLNPQLTLLAGSQQNKFSYGDYIGPATRSALHYGFTATHPLSSASALFATVFGGHDVLLKELGISLNLSKTHDLSISYVERTARHVAVDLVNAHADYAMSGISVRYRVKL